MLPGSEVALGVAQRPLCMACCRSGRTHLLTPTEDPADALRAAVGPDLARGRSSAVSGFAMSGGGTEKSAADEGPAQSHACALLRFPPVKCP